MSQAKAQEPVYDIDIPQQDAATSLEQLAEQTGAITLYRYDLAAAQQANGVLGRYTLPQALDVLLEGTILSGDLSNQRVISISHNGEADYQEEEEHEDEDMQPVNTSFPDRLVAAVASLFVASTAVGQTETGDSGVEETARLPLLEEVVVTARKREENLLEVPVSISVFSSNLIDEAGIVEPRDFFELSPGLDFDVEHDRIGSQPAVRGVQSNNTATTRQKVTSFIDGLPMIGAAGSVGFAGVERIEVFRGPQSAAFGRATFAGAINYVTQDPGDEFAGKIEASGSQLGRNALQIELSGPINDTLGYTFTARSDAFDGADDWVSSEGFHVGGNSTEFISGKLAFAPNDRFSGEVQLRHTKTDDDIPLRYFISAEEQDRCSNFTSRTNRNYIRGVFTCDTSTPVGGVQTNADTVTPFLGAPYTDADRAVAAQYRFDPTSINIRDRLQGEFTVSFDSGDLQVLAFLGDESYHRWFDRDRSNAPLTIAPGSAMASGRQVRHISDPTEIDESMLEVRWLSAGSDRFTWTLGASYYDYNFDSQLYNRYAVIVEGGSINPFLILSENSQNAAVFANLSYNISDRTTISFEGRYQTEDMANLNTITNEFFVNTSTAVLPRISINHTLDNGINVYGQIAKGVNPAGVNASVASPDTVAAHEHATSLGYIDFSLDSVLTYAQEEIINSEVGIKASLADGRVQLSAALYRMDWEHYNQIGTIPFDVITLWQDTGMVGEQPTYLPGLTARAYSARAFLDLGSAHVNGIEAETRWFLNDNWELSGSFTLQGSEFEEYCDATSVGGIGLAPTNEIGDGSGVLIDCVDVSGNEFSRQPDIAYVVASTYRTTLAGTGWDLMARLDYRLVGEQWLDVVNMAALPETQTLNGSVSFGNGPWNVRIWGRNLTDDDTPRVVEFSTDYNASPRGVTNFNVLPRAPTELGATLEYRF